MFSTVTKFSIPGQSWGLSVTRNHNLLVTLFDTNQLQEYTTDGHLVRTIRLDDSIDEPRHAVELSTGQLVVCHHSDKTQHRVLLVDTEGRIVRSYGGAQGSAVGQLSGPVYLAVDSFDNVLVADFYNYRLSLLNSEMTRLGDVPLTNGFPYRLYFDQLNGLLYTGTLRGQVTVFKI